MSLTVIRSWKIAEVTKKGYCEDSGLGVVTWRPLRLPVTRTQCRGETLRCSGEVGVREASRPWALTKHLLLDRFNLVTAIFAFFAALEWNPKPQDLKFCAAAQV